MGRGRAAPAGRGGRRAPVVPELEVEARAAALLRRTPMPLVPLDELYLALARDLGAAAGDVPTLRERLAARPDLFLVVESASPLPGAQDWPAADRQAYGTALRTAGWGAGPLVGAAPFTGGREAAPETPEAHVAAVLAQLAVTAARDEGLRERLSDALPLAEATMRALTEALRARREARQGAQAEACAAAADSAPEAGAGEDTPSRVPDVASVPAASMGAAAGRITPPRRGRPTIPAPGPRPAE